MTIIKLWSEFSDIPKKWKYFLNFIHGGNFQNFEFMNFSELWFQSARDGFYNLALSHHIWRQMFKLVILLFTQCSNPLFSTFMPVPMSTNFLSSPQTKVQSNAILFHTSCVSHVITLICQYISNFTPGSEKKWNLICDKILLFSLYWAPYQVNLLLVHIVRSCCIHSPSYRDNLPKIHATKLPHASSAFLGSINWAPFKILQ